MTSITRDIGADGAQGYYGKPVIAEPVWTPEIPVYFFTGGLAGASAGLAAAAELSGNGVLARRAWPIALAAATVSPVLLISDLGRPARFLNMLRVFKVTSPMSVGSWILAGLGPATAIGTAHSVLGLFPRGVGRVAQVSAALLGLPLSTYTATLISNTAVPVWHEARYELPFVFAGSAAASAGAAAAIATSQAKAGPARRLAVGGVAVEMAASTVMEKRLADLAEPYHGSGPAARYSKLARALSLAGAALMAGGGRRRVRAAGAGALILAGSLSERWSIFRAGFESASDPKYTVGPQRARAAARARSA